MCKVSVLVPVYNVEAYLPKCLDSLIGQTLREIEIICIDDGSTDRSGEILDEYAEKDKRIHVVHQENGGLAFARNKALDLVKTEYLTFVDSDDYIDVRMLEKMLQIIQEKQADICICNCFLPDSGYRSVSQYKFNMRDEVITGYQALKYMNLPKSWPWVTAWNKLYRTELFLNLRYPDGVQHEDQFLAHYVFSRAKNVVSISDTFYYLQYRENSITNSKYTIHQLDYMDALYDRIQFYQKNGFKKLYGGVEWKALKLLLQAYRKLEKLNSQEQYRLQQAEVNYQKIYQIASGRNQLSLLRKGVCTFVKSICYSSSL